MFKRIFHRSPLAIKKAVISARDEKYFVRGVINPDITS